MKLGPIFLLTIMTLFFTRLSAKTFYVSPDGNDANAGNSKLAPWKTINMVNSKDYTGDTILFEGGRKFYGGLYFSVKDIGSAVRPIVISSYGTGRAVIAPGGLTDGFFAYNTAGFKILNIVFSGTGVNRSERSGIVFYMDQDSIDLSYIRIDKVEVLGFKYSGISFGSWDCKSGYYDISVTNCKVHDNGLNGIDTYAQLPYLHKKIFIAYNTVYNNSGLIQRKSGNSGSGIVLGGVNGGTVQYCTVYNNGYLHSNNDGGPVGIWAYESNKVIIQYNESHHNKTNGIKDGGGFDLDGGCTNSIIQYNYSHDNDGPGYLAAQYSGAPAWQNNIIRYNISENDALKNDYGAIHFWSYSSLILMKNAQVYNNTIYVAKAINSTTKALCIDNDGMSNISFYNNIFHAVGKTRILSAATPVGISFYGNNYWSDSAFSISWAGNSFTSFADWQLATGQEKFNGQSTGYQLDPMYADAGKGYIINNARNLRTLKAYKLLSSSGMINSGLNLSKLFGINPGSVDFWGAPLAGKVAFNIGAYQGVAMNGQNLGISADNFPVHEQGLDKNIQVYPNPVIGQSFVYLSSEISGNIKITLSNLDGQILRTVFEGKLSGGALQKYILNASSLPAGIYIITVAEKENIIGKKGILKL